MARARGANAILAIGLEPSYGVAAEAGTFYRSPFVSANLGDEQPLEESDVLGFGRRPQHPGRGAVDNTGDVVTPMCARNIGLWLTLMFGLPATTAIAGGFRHTFESGALVLPSASIEVGMPEVPNFALNTGVKANTFGVPLQRSGNLNATIGLIAQGEAPANATVAGALEDLAMAKFSAFSGKVTMNGQPFGADLVAGQLNLTNGLDPVPTVGRGDGRIGGVDEGMFGANGQVGIRFSTRELHQRAESGEPCQLVYSWSIPDSIFALGVTVHAVYLPRAKTPITGPAGVQADYNWQAAQAANGKVVSIVLDNDVEEYFPEV